jgi:uncharacterized protein YjiK
MFLSQNGQIKLDRQFDYALEISSLENKTGNVLLLSEKCKRLYYIDKLGKLISTFDLNNGDIQDKNVEIEGMSFYQNGLLFSDEKNAKIYSLSFSDSSIVEVESNYDLSGDVDEYGMEGISVDEGNSICYIMKEKNGNRQSQIHVFKIVQQDGKITLKFIKNIFIEQNDNSWRYTDLCFNPQNNYLYCLKTKPGIYQIDTISTLHIDHPGDTIIKRDTPKLLMDISVDVNKYGTKGFSTNMEGIAINDNSIYLVSDNSQISYANCDSPGQGKTLLIVYKLKFP